MLAENSTRAIDLLIVIKNQNIEILTGITELLSETKEVKRINDEQLTELKKPKTNNGVSS